MENMNCPNRTIRLSPSKLNLYNECKRCFWMDVNKKIKRPNGIFPSLPSGMDLVLKRYFDECRFNNILPPELTGKIQGKLFSDTGKLQIWRSNFRGLEYVDGESGAILRGALDDLIISDDGSHIPVDFKSRGFALKEDTSSYYQNQMNLYAFLLSKAGMKVADFSCLIFYYPTKTEGSGKFTFNVDVVKLKTNIKEAEKLFRDAVELLNSSEPETNNECQWCSWRNS